MKRMRITFAKTDLIRYIGHLDVYHIWIRMFRRAKIHLVHSQGYHPQPKIQLASALSLGYTGSHELLECWLEEDLSTDQVFAKLDPVRHPGIRIQNIAEIPLPLAAMQTRLNTQTYHVQIFDAQPEEMQQKLTDLAARPELWVERKKKQVNIRPYWVASRWLTDKPGDGLHLELKFTAGDHANGRPDEILRLLDLDPLDCLVERTEIALAPI